MTTEQTEYLRSLERNGKLTAEQVLDAAKPAESPIHDCFEWENSTAAYLYRLDQARELIRRVRIEVVYEETTIKTVAYTRDPEAEKQNISGYVNLLSAKKRVTSDIVAAEWLRVLSLAERALNITKAKSDKLPAGMVERCEKVLELIRLITG